MIYVWQIKRKMYFPLMQIKNMIWVKNALIWSYHISKIYLIQLKIIWMILTYQLNNFPILVVVVDIY